MGKFKILVAGHQADISFAIGADRTFSGTFSSDKGDGIITGAIAADGSYEGTANMGGHLVGFAAVIDGNVITGKFHFGWIPVRFEGVAV